MPNAYERRWEQEGLGALGTVEWVVSIMRKVGDDPHDEVNVWASTPAGALALAEESQVIGGQHYYARPA